VTWIEAALGVAVLGLIVGGVVAVMKPEGRAQEVDVAVKSAQRIREAGLSWRNDNSSGCPTLSQLQHEHKLSSDARTDDPWGQRYRVDCRNDDIVVVSPGRDGKLGTDDDVRVPRS
jgi:general secretion pathway protein G